MSEVVIASFDEKSTHLYQPYKIQENENLSKYYGIFHNCDLHTFLKNVIFVRMLMLTYFLSIKLCTTEGQKYIF